MEFRDFFFHEHPLMLHKAIEMILCNACCEWISGPAYTCNECKFKIHKSCSELPQEFQNPYHPHSFTLVRNRRDRYFQCYACLQNQCGFFYHCGECEFVLDPRCSLWKLPSTDECQDQLQHSTHFHPLVATGKKMQDNDGDDDDDDDEEDSCKICGKPSPEALYFCDNCNFFLHQSCALQLPPNLQHFYHPCLLTLSPHESFFKCKACGVSRFSYSYFCKPCDFSMEIACAQLPTDMESLGQRQFHHFSHGHPLKLTETELDEEVICSACQMRCSDQTYVCCSSKCKFFLHDSCFSLPQKIRHPFHPQHYLTLYSPIQHQIRPECRICYRFCSGFTYSCICCRFHMDVECPVTISTINYQGHHHNIVFVDHLDPLTVYSIKNSPEYEGHHQNISSVEGLDDGDDTCRTYVTKADEDDDDGTCSTILLCSACGTSCKNSKAMFHCVQCDFNLHFKCGLLPNFLKHDDHPCSLKLIDSPVIVEREDKDTDVFYCDVCEKERDPRLPVYYCCDGCAYIAEIKCMIVEVMHSLRGDCGAVGLRSIIFKHKAGKVICKGIERSWQDSLTDTDTEVGEHEVNPSLTTEQVFFSLSEHEKFKITRAFTIALIGDQGNWQQYHWLSGDNGIFWHCDDKYTKLQVFIDTIFSTLCVNNKEVVYAGDQYSVRSDLAPIFEDLCAKHGEIIPKSALDLPKVTSFFVNTLCETVRSMCTIRVVDISEAKISSWWRCLTTLQYIGFKVEFALHRLKRVVNDYNFIKCKKDIGPLERKIEELSQHIKELEAKLTTLKDRRKEREAGTSMVAEHYIEDSVLKWMIAGDGLL